MSGTRVGYWELFMENGKATSGTLGFGRGQAMSRKTLEELDLDTNNVQSTQVSLGQSSWAQWCSTWTWFKTKTGEMLQRLEWLSSKQEKRGNQRWGNVCTCGVSGAQLRHDFWKARNSLRSSDALFMLVPSKWNPSNSGKLSAAGMPCNLNSAITVPHDVFAPRIPNLYPLDPHSFEPQLFSQGVISPQKLYALQPCQKQFIRSMIHKSGCFHGLDQTGCDTDSDTSSSSLFNSCISRLPHCTWLKSLGPLPSLLYRQLSANAGKPIRGDNWISSVPTRQPYWSQ